jgi:hypothetical protein
MFCPVDVGAGWSCGEQNFPYLVIQLRMSVGAGCTAEPVISEKKMTNVV